MRKLNPFKPTDIGGCQLWLDGADVSSFTFSSGQNISIWKDKSSLANNFTSTNTTSPTKTTTPGGYPCVYLNGSTCQMTSVSNNSTTGNSSRTVIMISQTGAGGDSRFGTGPHGGASPPNTYGIDLAPIANIIFCPYVYTGSDVTAYGVPNTNMYSLYSYYNSSTSTVGGIVNFTLTASNSTTLNTSATPWYLGLRPDGGYSINAYVCEIIQYNLILTTAQRQQVEGYLAQKWGLEANLPAGSPGRTQVIYPHTLRLNSLTTGQPTRLPLIRQMATTLQTRTFTYTGSLQSFVVPATISSITVYMWGAGGGGGYVTHSFTPGSGGAGAMIQGTFSVTPGQTLYIIVGGGGSFGNVNNQTDAEGGGGKAYYDINATLWGAGSGGGRSAIQLSAGDIDYIVVGGGGGGAVTKEAIINGGSATFSGTANGGTGSTGGTQISGGTPGFNGETGSKKFGGAGWLPGNFGGGGGGGGYWGGGGGGIVNGYGSGGGGSSYTGNLSNVLGYNSANGVAAPNTISQYYQSGIAVGGSPSFTGGTPGTINLGGNGLVVLTYYS